MSQREITFNRQVFNKSKFNDTVDTEFTQLIQTPDETFFDVNLATVEDFFTIYGNLFFDILSFICIIYIFRSGFF